MGGYQYTAACDATAVITTTPLDRPLLIPLPPPTPSPVLQIFPSPAQMHVNPELPSSISTATPSAGNGHLRPRRIHRRQSRLPKRGISVRHWSSLLHETSCLLQCPRHHLHRPLLGVSTADAPLTAPPHNGWETATAGGM